MYIDNAVLDALRARAHDAGTGYQTAMNDALRQDLAETDRVTESRLGRNPARGDAVYSFTAVDVGDGQPRAEMDAQPASLRLPFGREMARLLCVTALAEAKGDPLCE